jgi:hypothetical protein
MEIDVHQEVSVMSDLERAAHNTSMACSFHLLLAITLICNS